MKAIDSSADTTGKAKQIADAGYGAVGVYLRPDRCSLAMIQELHKAAIKVWSLYEKGHPDHDEYFSGDQGKKDGKRAADFAKSMGQPKEAQIYATVDYGADDSNEAAPTIRGRISDYMREFQAAIKPAGYVASVYGAGRTCRILIAEGLAQTGWLTMSTDYAEYQVFKPKAGIVQVKSINKDWDLDDIRDPNVVGLW